MKAITRILNYTRKFVHASETETRCLNEKKTDLKIFKNMTLIFFDSRDF